MTWGSRMEWDRGGRNYELDVLINLLPLMFSPEDSATILVNGFNKVVLLLIVGLLSESDDPILY